MSRRQKEKERSLAALAKLARSTPPPPPPPSTPAAAPPRPPAPPRATPPAPPEPKRPTRPRRAQSELEGRRAKQAEARALKARRENELFRATNLEWRGMPHADVPTGIRRTAFDRAEPSVSQKVEDVLGDPAEKAGRAKHRDRGRRQRGGR